MMNGVQASGRLLRAPHRGDPEEKYSEDRTRTHQKRRTRYVSKKSAISGSIADALSRLSGEADAVREMRDDMKEVEQSDSVHGAAPSDLESERDGEHEPDPGSLDGAAVLGAMSSGSHSLVSRPFAWGRIVVSLAAATVAGRMCGTRYSTKIIAGTIAASAACLAARWAANRAYDWSVRMLVNAHRDSQAFTSGVPARPRRTYDDLASACLFIKNALNPDFSEECRWELVSTALHSGLDDGRAPYQRGSKMEPDQIAVHEHVRVDPWFGPIFTVYSVPEITSQTVIRLGNCDRSDAAKISLTIASRISMLNVPKQLADEIFHGSATIARAIASQRRLQDNSHEIGGDWMATACALLASLATTVALGGAAPASVGALTRNCSVDGQFIIDVVFSPYCEEWFKELMRWLGIKRPSVVFGALEFALGWALGGADGNVERLLPALTMHCFADIFSVPNRILIHQLFNLAVTMCRHRRVANMAPGSLAGRTAAMCLGSLTLNAVNAMSRRARSRSPGLGDPGREVLSCFGYRFGDRLVPWTEKLPTPGIRVMKHANFDEDQPRARMMISLGPVVEGHCPAVPDRNHYPSVLHGVLNRFCSEPPAIDRALLLEFASFVREEVRQLPVVDPDADMTPECWLSETHYPKWRQDQLMEGWDNSMRMLSLDDFFLDGFMKTETYLKFANPRGINSRSDNFKVAIGPCCKHMEHIVYAHYAEFIKNVPVRDRPRYIMNLMSHLPSPYYETDYTAFERHFVPDLLRACEMLLYEHLLHHFPELYNILETAMCGLNRIRYKAFTICVKGRRMSGEMVTSLGNGFTNLMLAKFVALKSGAQIVGVVEGDDGLFATNRPLNEELFGRLGFTIKIQKRESLLESSFCGLMMSDDLISFTDPYVALCNLGWSTSPQAFQSERVRKELLRAKALSLLHEHPRCPMLSAVASRLIEITNGYSPRYTSGWYKWKLQGEIESTLNETMEMARTGPSDSARDCFYRLYGASPAAQIDFERYVGGWSGGPLSHYALEMIADAHPSSACFREMWHDYVSSSPSL